MMSTGFRVVVDDDSGYIEIIGEEAMPEGREGEAQEMVLTIGPPEEAEKLMASLRTAIAIAKTRTCNCPEPQEGDKVEELCRAVESMCCDESETRNCGEKCMTWRELVAAARAQRAAWGASRGERVYALPPGARPPYTQWAVQQHQGAAGCEVAAVAVRGGRSGSGR